MDQRNEKYHIAFTEEIEKDGCRKRISISDENLLGRITELVNRVIISPERMRLPKPANRQQHTELRRLNNDEEFFVKKETRRKQPLQSVSQI